MKKILLRRGDCLALRQYPHIEADHSLAPPGQVNERIINAGTAPLKMDQLTALKVEMQHPYPYGVAQRQAASSACSANPGDHHPQIPQWFLPLNAHVFPWFKPTIERTRTTSDSLFQRLTPIIHHRISPLPCQHSPPGKTGKQIASYQFVSLRTGRCWRQRLGYGWQEIASCRNSGAYLFRGHQRPWLMP